MRVHSFLLFGLLAALLGTCTPDQRDTGRLAEQAYVDLLHAVHTKNARAAKAATQKLDKNVAKLRGDWQSRLAQAHQDNRQYHLDHAVWSYSDVRSSLAQKDFELASIQLDRATYEVSAAIPAIRREFYVGTIYDFLVAWFEVERTIGDPDLCGLEWPAFEHYARDLYREWRQIKRVEPPERIYGIDTFFDPSVFGQRRYAVEKALENLQIALESENQCHVAREATPVSVAIWDLVLLFGTPVNGLAVK